MSQDRYAAAFFEFVTNRRLEHPWNSHCPICDKKSEILSSATTLLGWSGRGPNPNHRTDYHYCEDRHEFQRHAKSDNEWICHSNGLLILGVPNCFEPFIYHCAACGGQVMRKASTTYVGNQRHSTWTCSACHRTLETDFEYWTKED